MMAKLSDVQALEKISTEVDESQIKIILSTQCIKAQAFLVDKLKKQSDCRKERCGFLSSANLILESEIKQAEHEIKNLQIAYATIKMANVELKKEWLLAKEQKLDIIERVKKGEKKYEGLWLESKSRYESIPHVEKLLQTQDRVQIFKEEVKVLKNEAEKIVHEIERKKKICLHLDRKRVVEVAEFIIHEMPNSIKLINKKTIQLNDLKKSIKAISKDKEVNANVAIDVNESAMQEEDSIIHIKAVLDDDDDEGNLIMPKLELVNIDLDVLTIKLDQLKVKNAEMMYISPEKRGNYLNSYGKDEKEIEYISSYFNKPTTVDTVEEKRITNNYPKKKLINILEDIKVNQTDTYNLVSKVNPDKLQPVNNVGAEMVRYVTDSPKTPSDRDKPLISEEIEEVDLTSLYTESILIPPSQFLDVSLGQKTVIFDTLPTSQENATFYHSKEALTKKKVSFDLPNTLEIHKILEHGDGDENDANETMNSQLDVSAVGDESFTKIKDMILTKHNLDLSPQFVYAKNNTLQIKSDDKNVTSKFFQNNNETDGNTDKVITESQFPDDKRNDMEVDEIEQNPNDQNRLDKQTINYPEKKFVMELDVDDMAVSSPKKQKTIELLESDKPVSGFLLTHGPQAIPDSLNVSMSTGCEEGDADFPHCIDSSLLLSPKADYPMPMSSEHPEVLSQEVPNFLSGLHKTGLSFFGCMPSSEPKPDSSAQIQRSFKFNFGGKEKKNRGGLFSMFQ